MKFIHLTDIHVTTPEHLLFGRSPNLILERCVADINLHHADAEFCVITGDLTHNGTPSEYREACRILEKLRPRTLMLIGNHDERAPALEHFRALRSDTNGFVQQAVETSAGVFVLMDTKTLGTDAGSYCAHRQIWLERTLSEHRDRPVWLFMHHPPFDVGMPAMDQIAMNADHATAISNITRQHDDIRHMFYGHYHRPMSGVWNKIPFSSHRSMMLQCALDLQESCDVGGIFEEPQYAIVTVENHLTRVHYHDFDSGSARLSMGPPVYQNTHRPYPA